MPDLDREALMSALDVLPVGVMILCPQRGEAGRIEDFKVLYVNEALLRIDGFEQDMVGNRMRARIPQDAESIFDRYVLAFEHNRPLDDQVDLLVPAAPTQHYDVRARRVHDLLMVQVADVSAEVAAREAEEVAHRRVTEMLERINDAMYSLDAGWRFTFVNAEAGRLVGGWSPADMIGRNLWDTFPGLVGNDFERHFRHAVAYQEIVDFEAYYAEPLNAWFTVRAYPSGDGLTVFFQNVSARHRVEERAVDLERLESTANLARGASQELNTLLMVIGGHAELLEESLSAHDPRLEDVRPIQEAIRRAASLTQKLLSFGHSQEVVARVVDLQATVVELVPVLRQILPPSVHLEVPPVDEPVLVDVDPEHMQRSIMHLTTNAAQAMPRGGSITITVSERQVDDAESLAHPQRAPGWYGVLTVDDEGEGMAEDVRRSAVRPFFTTRESNGATGLGLAAVHDMVRRAGGFLALESTPGVGTKVSVHLPLSSS